MNRVKLYVLNENRQWDDKGKGYVSVAPKSAIQSAPHNLSSNQKNSDAPSCDEELKSAEESLNESTPVENGSEGQVDNEKPEKSVSCNDGKEMMIIMKSEADPNVILLQSKIQADTIYQKQQDTLIVWNSETEGDLALSFEEIKGCSTIYDQIWAYQNEVSEASGDDQSPLSNVGDVTEPNETSSALSTLSSAFNESEAKCNNIVSLLSGDMEGLLEVAKMEMLRWDFEYHMMNAKYKENICKAIEADRLIPKMINLFHRCEEENFTVGLECLYSIFKSLVSMGKTSLYDTLFSELYVDDVIGILEYAPGKSRQMHRQFISRATLKEALPIKKEKLLMKIRQTYKVQYIHDVILPTPPIMEEMNLYTLQSFIYLNKAEIVTMIQEDSQFVKGVIGLITKDDSSYEEKKNSFGFLKELCAYSQCLDALKREAFFVYIIEIGVLKAISHILCLEIDELASKEEIDDTVQLQWAAVEVFAYFIEVCPTVVRDFILNEHRENLTSDETLLINLLLYQMLNDRDIELGGALQVLNLFRILLDFSIDTEDSLVAARHVLDPFNRQLDSKDSFLSMFYSRCVPILVNPVLSMTSDPDSLSRDDYRSALSAQVILRLLIYCLSHGHGFHIRNYLIKNELIGRFLLLMKSKFPFLVLTTLKFLRTIIGLKDDVFTRHIVANKLLQPVVNAYLRNGHKYNLLNSALIELFDFLKTENVKLLILHYGENYSFHFQDVQYVNTFKDLNTRYAQLAEFEKHTSTSALGTPITAADYSDSENASEKSLQFLSPTIGHDSQGSKSLANRNTASAYDYDWLNSEDDDELISPSDDPTKQLLADSEALAADDEKWMQQWDFHTSQLQKKRQQKLNANNGSATPSNDSSSSVYAVFDNAGVAVRKKASASDSSLKENNSESSPSSGVQLNIAPIRKFTNTLAATGVNNKWVSEDLDNGGEADQPKNKVQRTNLDLDSPVVSPIPLSNTPPPGSKGQSGGGSSLVDYDSDSDEDYAADVEDLDRDKDSKQSSSRSRRQSPPNVFDFPISVSSKEKQKEDVCEEDKKQEERESLISSSAESESESEMKNCYSVKAGLDSSPETRSCRIEIEQTSLEDSEVSATPADTPNRLTLTPKRSRSFRETSDSQVPVSEDSPEELQVANGEVRMESKQTNLDAISPEPMEQGTSEDSPPRKRTKSVASEDN